MWINFCSHNYVGPTGDRNKYVLVQYMFEGPERQINGYSKGTTPYYRTCPSTYQKMKEAATSSCQKFADTHAYIVPQTETKNNHCTLLPTL